MRSHIFSVRFFLGLGVVGPESGQRWAQNYVHEDITGGADSLEAWKNQINTTYTINANYLYQKYLTEDEYTARSASFFYHYGFNVGNITNYGNVGATAVLFASESVFPSLALSPTIGKGAGSSSGYGNYIFLGVDARYFVSNLYIEGKGESQHDDIKLKPLVYDAYLGFRWMVPKLCVWGVCINTREELALNYLLFRRSKEFDSTNSNRTDSNTVGRINFTWSPRL